jgi:hypothetical protein
MIYIYLYTTSKYTLYSVRKQPSDFVSKCMYVQQYIASNGIQVFAVFIFCSHGINRRVHHLHMQAC